MSESQSSDRKCPPEERRKAQCSIALYCMLTFITFLFFHVTDNNRDILIPAFVFSAVFLMQTDERKLNCILENPITAETMNADFFFLN